MRQKFFHFAPVRAKQMSPGHPEMLYEGRWNFYCRKTAGQEKLSSFLLPRNLISQLLYLFYLPTNMATRIYPWRKAYFPSPLPSTACIICNSPLILLIYEVAVTSEQPNTFTILELPNTSEPSCSNICINLRFVLDE